MIDELEEEFLSTTEVVPTPAPESASRFVCPECGASATKLGIPFKTNVQLSTHIQRAHHRGESKPKTATKATAAKPGAKPTTAKRPAGPRKPLGESLARMVLQVGRVVNTAVDPPTGAAIMFEAGALGVAIDRAIAGTIIDKPLQKGAAISERFEPLIPLITMPAMVFMLSRNAAMEPMIEGELREALEDVLVQSLPLLKQRAARTRQTVQALEELRIIDKDLADSEDPIGAILRGFFAGKTEPEPAEPDAP
jgi:hypothetical protein